jgi:hypothetical protein
MRGIYEGLRSDGLRYHDIHTKFHKDWFRHLKVDGADAHTHTHRQQGDLMSLLLYFQYKENGLKNGLSKLK